LKIETLILPVRCSKHGIMSHFKVDNELMPEC